MSEHVPPFWHKHLPTLRATLVEAGDTHDAEDVLDMLRKGEAFWSANDQAFIVVEVITYPKRKVMNVMLGGGVIGQAHNMISRAEALAHVMKCDVIDVIGRAGWARVYRGYDRVGVILRKAVCDG